MKMPKTQRRVKLGKRFVDKLYVYITQCSKYVPSLIRWSDDGARIEFRMEPSKMLPTVKNMGGFQPRVLRHIQRQLCYYGFRCLYSTQARETPSIRVYQHENFHRDRPADVFKIERQIPSVAAHVRKRIIEEYEQEQEQRRKKACTGSDSSESATPAHAMYDDVSFSDGEQGSQEHVDAGRDEEEGADDGCEDFAHVLDTLPALLPADTDVTDLRRVIIDWPRPDVNIFSNFWEEPESSSEAQTEQYV